MTVIALKTVFYDIRQKKDRPG